MAARIVSRQQAGPDHEVTRVEGGTGAAYRKEPCSGCPWRTDQVGQWPAEAFIASAPTAYDMADAVFGCHESRPSSPATCAGFLLRGAEHNLAARLRSAVGRIDPRRVHDGGHELHQSYVDMATANGVPADHPALAECRSASGEVSGDAARTS